jgi:predicted O-linked N-acetylglucosamine transferase (SPINDLY family)
LPSDGPDLASAIARATTLLNGGSVEAAVAEAARGVAAWPASSELWSLLEAARLEAAYDAATRAAPDAGAGLALFQRLAAVDEADRLWPFETVGRDLAARGDHRGLISQLPRVRGDADRRDLLEQHRMWGRAAEARAAAHPIRPAPRGLRSRPRVALVSSDLRSHAIAPFVVPLVEGAGAAGVELYGYSAHSGPADGIQQYMAGRMAGLRHLPGADAIEMAQAIAADAPDVLIEIGGSTNENRLEAMAHRLAPVQLSWLGYPHSTGLGTIDGWILDPHLAPIEPGLMLERPLLMPKTWAIMSPGYFREDIPLPVALPQDRKGYVTFGTAGSPYKYSAATLAAWGQVLAAVPGSRFLFVRPEAASPRFRANVAAHFARQDVGADRLEFAPVRGGHLPYYGVIDISLDTFPLTGGMTTCEALWMGVPVVSLAGRAVYERLSHSLLTNAGLADLSTTSVEAFVARAVDLASDRERRRQWRAEGRAAIMGGPLGDLDGFARDFFALATRPL